MSPINVSALRIAQTRLEKLLQGLKADAVPSYMLVEVLEEIVAHSNAIVMAAEILLTAKDLEAPAAVRETVEESIPKPAPPTVLTTTGGSGEVVLRDNTEWWDFTASLTDSPTRQDKANRAAIPMYKVESKRVRRQGEKRSHRRVEMIASIEMSLEGYKIAGRLTDVSEGGFYVDTLTVFPEGTPGEFTLNLGGHRISGKGVVRNVNSQCGMGIQFTELDMDSYDALCEFLDEA